MKNKLKVVEALSMVVQIGLNMLVSIFLCLALGLYIDKHFGTSLTIFFLVFGIISGYCGAYSTFKTLIERSTKDADALYAGLDMPENENSMDATHDVSGNGTGMDAGHDVSGNGTGMDTGHDVSGNGTGMDAGHDLSGDRIEDDGFEDSEAEALGDEQRP